jgi:hypothetical protein
LANKLQRRLAPLVVPISRLVAEHLLENHVLYGIQVLDDNADDEGNADQLNDFVM